MGVSTEAILQSMTINLDGVDTGPDRFGPLLEMAVYLFRAQRADLLLRTEPQNLSICSSQYMDSSLAGGLRKLGQALVREWERKTFLLFRPEQVSSDFESGLLNRQPFRKRRFGCLMIADRDTVLAILFLDGVEIGEWVRTAETGILDVFFRLSRAVVVADCRNRTLLGELRDFFSRLRRSGLEELEKEGIIRALAKNDGNITRTHLELGVPRMSFYHKLRRYRIKPHLFRGKHGHPIRS